MGPKANRKQKVSSEKIKFTHLYQTQLKVEVQTKELDSNPDTGNNHSSRQRKDLGRKQNTGITDTYPSWASLSHVNG